MEHKKGMTNVEKILREASLGLKLVTFKEAFNVGLDEVGWAEAGFEEVADLAGVMVGETTLGQG
jgi:hypothetical protein